MKDTQAVRVRFGVFELDLKSGELRSGDENTCCGSSRCKSCGCSPSARAKSSPAKRSEELWPNDTIVEFDHSINAAIRKLRQALGDSADEPKYVETVARRGYRLMEPSGVD